MRCLLAFSIKSYTGTLFCTCRPRVHGLTGEPRYRHSNLALYRRRRSTKLYLRIKIYSFIVSNLAIVSS